MIRLSAESRYAAVAAFGKTPHASTKTLAIHLSQPISPKPNLAKADMIRLSAESRYAGDGSRSLM